MLDKLGDAAVVLEFDLLRLSRFRIGRALVGKRDEQALVEESQLAQALSQGVEIVFGQGEDFFVRHEVDFGPSLHLSGAGFLQLAGGLTLGVGLLPSEAIAPDFEFELVAERVDARYAYSVQSAGDFIRRRVELAPGVQLGHHDLSSGNFFAIDIHRVDGNAAAVIDHRDGVVDVDGNLDLVGEAGERFVNGVVHYFVNEMVQPQLTRRPDVHGGAFADGFHAAQHFDRVGGVIAIAGVERRHLAVFCLGFFDGSSVQCLFGGHSTPWRMPDLSPGIGCFASAHG